MATTGTANDSRTSQRERTLSGALDRRAGRGVLSAIPTGLAAASFPLAAGVYLGKGAISPDLGDQVAVEPGLLLGLLTALAQTVVLGMGLASRHDDSHHSRSSRELYAATPTQAQVGATHSLRSSSRRSFHSSAVMA